MEEVTETRVEKIESLAQQKVSGKITQAEFDTEKKKILASAPRRKKRLITTLLIIIPIIIVVLLCSCCSIFSQITLTSQPIEPTTNSVSPKLSSKGSKSTVRISTANNFEKTQFYLRYKFAKEDPYQLKDGGANNPYFSDEFGKGLRSLMN